MIVGTAPLGIAQLRHLQAPGHISSHEPGRAGAISGSIRLEDTSPYGRGGVHAALMKFTEGDGEACA